MSIRMSKEELFSNWSELHGGAEVKGIVRAWLNISFYITRPLIILRLSPNSLSLLSIFAAGGFLLTLESHWAIALLVLSLLLDGIDGTVAIATGKSSKFGALVDSVADRLVEGLWAIALYLLGAPWQVVITAWLAAFVQEYLRARVGGLGVNQVLFVTWCERPVRATLIFIPLIGRLFGLDLFELAAWIWAIMQLTSALTLFNLLRLQLQQSQR
ncbi:MAG: CDP-alcohol phosphatidyltransferase family protein [Actinomycetota bacterium]